MKKVLLVAFTLGLLAGCSTTRPEQRCRDKSDATASISVDYCVWNQKTFSSNDTRQRTPGEWNAIVTWPSASRYPANLNNDKRGGDRIFR